MNTNTKVLPSPGDIVRVVGESLYPETFGAHKGETFRVDGVEPGLRPGDTGYGDPDYIQESVVTGWSERGSVLASLSSVEVIRPAGEVDAGAPTVKDVISSLSFDGDGTFDFDESYASDSHVEMVIRDAETGLRYGFTVSVGQISEVE